MSAPRAILRGIAAKFWQTAECLAEVAIVVFFGIFPFIVAVLRHNALAGSNIDVPTVFTESLSGGQLYLYAFSLFGTLLWLSVFNWTIPRRLYRLALAAIVIVLGFIIVALGGVDPTFSKLQNTAIVTMSFYCYGAFIVIYFLLLFGSKETPPAARASLDDEAKELMGKLRQLGARE